jgi:DNA polymerase I-like protein with 3'-5' exonuclease and polymerase domains
MLTPVEIAALVAATKGAIDLFDKIAGQLKSVLMKRPKEDEGREDRWRYKINTEGKNIVVKQTDRTVQTITGDQLARVLGPNDLELVSSYEKNMQRYFKRWQTVYASKDASQDPQVNAITEEQLTELIAKMKTELLGILSFLEHIGVHLDDHYMHIRQLVESV